MKPKIILIAFIGFLLHLISTGVGTIQRQPGEYSSGFETEEIGNNVEK